LDIGGTEKTLQIYCQYLDKSRFEVIACGRQGGGARVPELARLGIPTMIQPADITQLVRDLKIDIYHVHRAGSFEPGTLPEKQHGRPRIVETNVFHDFDAQEDGLIDFHCFVSEYSKKAYLRKNGMRYPGRYGVLYNPVDFSEFPARQKRFDATIGRCSRPDDQKWHDVCLTSLPRIFRKVPDARCILQGATERVVAKLTSLGLDARVHLLPPSVNISDFYQSIDVFIHGSRIGETFGCVIAEAMANGIPVVTLSTPGRGKSNAQVELVEHKVTGFVCRFGWQYSGAVIELLNNRDLRERLGRQGYEKAREEFDAAALTKQLEQIYLNLMDVQG
jgi:glycosyltransferase involved in cell wall biosynthesis